MVISHGTFALMIFTDRYFLSQVSPLHMAAALGGGVAAYFSFCFFSGLVAYANAMAAQYLGSGEKGKCSKVVTQGALMILGSLPPLTLITILVMGIFELMDHDPEQVELERTYYLILMAGVALTLAKACISSYFAGIGRSRVVMICDVCSLLINVPLCAVMVLGSAGLPVLGTAGIALNNFTVTLLGITELPALGMVGAGLSTIIATLFGLLLFLWFYFAKAHREEFQVLRSFHYDRGIFRRYLRLGFPSGMELFLNVAAFNLFLLMFQGYGRAEGASAAIVFNWDVLSFVPMMGLNIAVVSLIGRFVGAGNMARTNEVIAGGFLLGLGYSGILALLFITLRFPMVELFAPPDGDFTQIRQLAAFMMIGLATYTMADATILVAGGVMRGAGDTRWLMYASTSLHWTMLLIQIFVIRVFNYSSRASWLIFCLLIFAIALVYIWRLRSNRWRDPETLKAVMAEY